MTGLVVDLFAGGGGASVGLEAALGRPVDVAKFAARVRVEDGDDPCWTWTGGRLARRGGRASYGVFSLGRRGCTALAHRVAFMLVNGPIGADLVVCHRCDNPPCVNPAHLFVGTQAANLEDMREKGRAHFNTFPRGRKHPNAKLDADRVREMRALREAGLSLQSLGDRFGVHPATVHDIVRRRTWGHVE